MLETIGSDMEVFAIDKVGHGYPLCGKLGGTKEKPKPLSLLPKGFAIQEDNVTCEFNIPPTVIRDDFVRAMRIMRGEVEAIINKLGFSMSRDSSLTFHKDRLTHPKALVFGCEPDYNSWTMKENPKPESDNQELRTCGGHIHVGTKKDMVSTVKNMDLFLGVPSIILDNNPASIERRKLYGKAGAMRPKSYGFEYRTLSNFWLFSDELLSWIYSQTQIACSPDRTGYNGVEKYIKDNSDKIQNCINTGDVKAAEEIVKEMQIELP